MKLSHASNYAMHALVHMAGQTDRKPVSSHLIAAERGIPEFFLRKVLKTLVSAQVLLSLRGPHGGYLLARPAKQITLLEVVEAVDGPIRGDAPEVGQGAPMPRSTSVCRRCATVWRRWCVSGWSG